MNDAQRIEAIRAGIEAPPHRVVTRVAAHAALDVLAEKKEELERELDGALRALRSLEESYSMLRDQSTTTHQTVREEL